MKRIERELSLSLSLYYKENGEELSQYKENREELSLYSSIKRLERRHSLYPDIKRIERERESSFSLL